ncbi:hypothetical protein PVA38_11470 [Streptococcus pneumoniae D39]|nr:hypothetical protein PVA38_11470 [Streptococcus pneumoniae D39]
MLYGLCVVSVFGLVLVCLLYTSDAADEARSVDLGVFRLIQKLTQTVATEPFTTPHLTLPTITLSIYYLMSVSW